MGGVEKDIGVYQAKQWEHKKEWNWFLRKLLKSGYYLRRGVIPILEEMVEVGYTPKMQDMPLCLDEVSKKCLQE